MGFQLKSTWFPLQLNQIIAYECVRSCTNSRQIKFYTCFVIDLLSKFSFWGFPSPNSIFDGSLLLVTLLANLVVSFSAFCHWQVRLRPLEVVASAWYCVDSGLAGALFHLVYSFHAPRYDLELKKKKKFT